MRTASESDSAEASPAVEPEPATRRDHALQRWLFAISGVAAAASIVSAGVLAIVHHWAPVGDHAIFAVRARDVLSSHFPLLGTWTSASLATGVNVNNPGPLFFDAIALPTVAFGSAGAGVAVGVALVNVLCTAGIGIVAWRQGGLVVGSAAFATVTVLAWSMGSEVLIDPTQPGALLLPLLLLMMLSWGVARRDYTLLPWLVGVASFVLQTYITYVFIVGMLAVWAIVCMGLRLRAAGFPADELRRVRRMSAIAVIVGVLCWLQPLAQQFVGEGPGNIGRLWKAGRQPSPTLGFNLGTRIMAEVVTIPPWWFRPSFHNFLASDRTPSTSLAVAIITLAILFAGVLVLARRTLRRGDDVVGTAAATAAVALVAGVITAGRIPVGLFGASSHVYRWLWPLAAFVTFVLLIALVRYGLRSVRTVVVVGGLAVIAVVFAAWNLPTTDQGASATTSAIPVVRDLGRQLAGLRGRGPLVVDQRFVPFADPYSSAVLAQLQGHGIRFLVNDEGMPYQIGFFRRFNGRNAKGVLTIREGDQVDDAPPGSERVALHLGLSPTERDEMNKLEDALVGYLDRADGRAFVRGPDFAKTVKDLPSEWQVAAKRYLDLRTRWLGETVAIYLSPVSALTRPT
jgi:hypothetical protein